MWRQGRIEGRRGVAAMKAIMAGDGDEAGRDVKER